MNNKTIQEYKERFSKVESPKSSDQWEEHNRLLPIIEKIKELEIIDQKIQQANDLLTSPTSDADLKNLAQEDIRSLEEKKELQSTDLQSLIKEEKNKPDINDSRNAILEIRAGAGGDEAALFASDLFRMYSQYATRKGFTVEILDKSLSESGGMKEITAKIKGSGAFGRLKYESGVHRVQRIPVTESSGRIHTSTASVAVLPEAKDIDMEINPEEIRIDVLRSSGAGGQHVNKTESAVRMTHIPTGIVVKCQEERSQLKNREIAMSILRSRLLDLRLSQQQEEIGSIRRGQIGNAMRAEKIRTYNFPQSRVTDHRIKQSWHNIEEIMNGEIDEIIDSIKGYETNSAE